MHSFKAKWANKEVEDISFGIEGTVDADPRYYHPGLYHGLLYFTPNGSEYGYCCALGDLEVIGHCPVSFV